MIEIPEILINLTDVTFTVYGNKGELFDAGEGAAYNNEARYQLKEGCFYDFEFSETAYYLEDCSGIVKPHKRHKHLGRLEPNIYVGTLELTVLKQGDKDFREKIYLEVQSVKTSYRDDYRDMLEYITEKCTDLLLQANAPVLQQYEPDYENEPLKTLYQRFAFVKSVISSNEFLEAVHRIVTTPATKWIETIETRDIRQVRRLSSANVKEVLKSTQRITLPEHHSLRQYKLTSIPDKIVTSRKADSVDTPENRFVKHALETFLKFCDAINKVASKGSKLYNESDLVIQELEAHLHYSIFRDIQRPQTLKLNSPLLQRREGYREILRAWLMFDLAAKLVWSGGEDVYGAGKKDIATLYEYWLFFKLLEVLQDIFKIEAKEISKLVKSTPHNLALQLNQGKFIPLKGIYNSGNRKLQIQFSYNRSFGKSVYPDSGSWTITMRPDYTLSVWPYGIDEASAEKEELIVHIHFDAKYKVAAPFVFSGDGTEVTLNMEKQEQRKGTYKNADLLKMHAYKDAIRRTGGAYVLYPGTEELTKKGFHEIIPGLGAFPVRPSKTNSGVNALKSFIEEVVAHFINRTSQREKIALRAYDVYKTQPEEDNMLHESLPEPYGKNRNLLPDETFVLVGYVKTPKHYEWYKKEQIYNFRTESKRGSLILDKETVSAKYLLLHKENDASSGDLWKITSKGPKVYSKNKILSLGYPDKPSMEYYLVITIEPVTEAEFKDLQWNFKKLANNQSGNNSAVPFTASLTELMLNKVK